MAIGCKWENESEDGTATLCRANPAVPVAVTFSNKGRPDVKILNLFPKCLGECRHFQPKIAARQPDKISALAEELAANFKARNGGIKL